MSTHAATHGHSHHHISPIRLYLAVWIGLMILTAITVGVYKFDFGALNVVIAMAVATVKASLVVLFFMHLKYDKPFHAVAFSIGIIFFGLFLGLQLVDVATRTDPEPTRDFAPVERPSPPAEKKTTLPAEHAGESPAGHTSTAGSATGSEPAAQPSAAPSKAPEHK
ncbi:MAG TPA: cytochrome C oxidase subunit IV family protein [Blastocatellia bacterium]|nr:cytochrome C oxidase subunit IV family protein [Blastocatellia bacterium]